MKIFLASQLKNEKTLEVLKEYLANIQDLQNKEVTFIPTASNSEESFGKWKTGSTFKRVLEIFPHTKVLEVEFVTDEDALETIKNTDILIVLGGYPAYLSYWLYRRKIVNQIKQNLNTGMIYIGSSAGAMVCSKTLRISEFIEEEVMADKIPGMGIIDYEILPHYTEDQKELLDRVSKENNIKIKPLRDGEQIVF